MITMPSDFKPAKMALINVGRILRRRGVSPLGLVGLVAIAAAALLPLTGSTFYLRLGIEALLLGCLALSVDILLGVTGLLSLGQAAFFGLAAYTGAIVLVKDPGSFWLAFVMSISVTVSAAAVFGAIAIRVNGVYFALITFAFSEVMYKLVFHSKFVGGSDGLLGIKPPMVSFFGLAALPLSNNLVFFYAALAVVTGLYLGVRRILATPFGSVLSAIRDNEGRVTFVGYDPFWYKWLAFVLAAAVAGVGGFFHPLLRGFASPDLLGFEVSTKAVVMTIVGGMGTLLGPVIGAVIITFIELFVGIATERHLLVIGALFVLCVVFRPQGLLGDIAQRARLPRSTGAD
jgi:branched-chain amino acid transport system permease protein